MEGTFSATRITSSNWNKNRFCEIPLRKDIKRLKPEPLLEASLLQPSNFVMRINSLKLTKLSSPGSRNTAKPTSQSVMNYSSPSYSSALKNDEPMSDSYVSMSWIQKWKYRHNIASVVMCGESGDVFVIDTQYWNSTTLPNLLQRFSPADIWMRKWGWLILETSSVKNVTEVSILKTYHRIRGC